MVTGANDFDAGDMRSRRFRVLVPADAQPFYLLARGRIGSWDPVMFGLLIADSLFVAATATLVFAIGHNIPGSSAVGLVGALLYLVNFAVPNLRLVGLVDAAEGFFVLAALWSLSKRKMWLLPLIAILGALSKESFLPFFVAITAAWWLSDDRYHRNDDRNRRNDDRNRRNYGDAALILISWALSVAAMIAVQWAVVGRLVSPMQFGLALQRGDWHFAFPFLDRSLFYIFIWLLPTALPNLKRFPKPWLISVGTTCVVAFVLDGYFGGGPSAGSSWGRTLFSIAGPLLSLSSALFLLRT